MMLNSSTYGIPFYKLVGFLSVEEEKTRTGIGYTQMDYRSEGRT